MCVHQDCRTELALLVLLVCSGCNRSEPVTAEHHVPAHMPASFPAAVDQLTALHREIVDGRERPRDQLDPYTEACDVARWLPGLAADSDLEEQAWMRVDDVSHRLEELLSGTLSRTSGARRPAYLERAAEIERLQRELGQVKRLFPTDSLSAGESEASPESLEPPGAMEG